MKIAPASSLVSWLIVIFLSAPLILADDPEYPTCDDVPNTNVTVKDQDTCVIACEANDLDCKTFDNGTEACGATLIPKTQFTSLSCFCGPDGLNKTIVCRDDDDDDDKTSGGASIGGFYYLATGLTAVFVSLLA